MMSSGANPSRPVSKSWARTQIDTLRPMLSAWPCSSKAITTTAAPWRSAVRACARKAASPSFRLMELTIGRPCTHFRPASITDHLDESIITGTRAMSGSAPIKLRNRTMAACESSMPSSMFTSMICAPFATCWRATSTAPA